MSSSCLLAEQLHYLQPPSCSAGDLQLGLVLGSGECCIVLSNPCKGAQPPLLRAVLRVVHFTAASQCPIMPYAACLTAYVAVQLGLVLGMGMEANRIVFANPCKA